MRRTLWDDAARAWSGFSPTEIESLLAELSPAKLGQLSAAADRIGATGLRAPIASALGPSSPGVWEGQQMGWWGTSGATEIWGEKRHAQTFDSYEAAIAYGESLGKPAGVAREGSQFTVYDLNRSGPQQFVLRVLSGQRGTRRQRRRGARHCPSTALLSAVGG